MANFPTAESIQAAHDRLRPYIHRTPVLASSALNEMAGAQLYFKCENFQKIGAFKIRGATNGALQLNKDQAKNGLATHSSGNHAQAVAVAARNLGVPAYIVMPDNSPKVKINAVKGYGAEVILCEPVLQAREDGLKEVIDRTGAIYIPSFDHYHTIEGQATAAKELIEDQPGLEIITCPVGGGGLLAGTALSAHYFSDARVIAAEPEGADDAYRSFQAGHLIPSTNPNTIADGLLTSVGRHNFPIIQQHVSAILTVNDEEILAAMRLVWERMKIVIEPSSAVPVAAIFKYPEHFQGKSVGVILSGGNVDLGRSFFH